MSFVVDKEGVYLTKGGDTVEITSVTERIDEWKWKKRGCGDCEGKLWKEDGENSFIPYYGKQDLIQYICPLNSIKDNTRMFKEGDIVVIDNPNHAEYRKGVITTVCSIDSRGDLWLENVDGGSQYCHNPKDVRHATEAEKAAFLRLGTKYNVAHGDMDGWRYLDKNESVIEGDEFFSKENGWTRSSNHLAKCGVQDYFVYRRRLEVWQPTVGGFAKYRNCKYYVVGKPYYKPCDQKQIGVPNCWIVQSTMGLDSNPFFVFERHLSEWVEPKYESVNVKLNGQEYKVERHGDKFPTISETNGN